MSQRRSVNAAFPFAVAIAIAIPLRKSRNVRNYFFIRLVMLLGLLVLAVHLTPPQSLWFAPRLSLQFALDVVLFMLVAIRGRVIPMFTNNAIPGKRATHQPAVEKLALGATPSSLGATRQ